MERPPLFPRLGCQPSAARAFLLVTLLVLSSFLAAPHARAAPINDAFSSALAISGDRGSDAASNVGATKEADEPMHAGSPGGASIWYRWTAPVSGRFTFDSSSDGLYSTEGECTFDTLLGIYTGRSVGQLLEVASSDDIPFPGVGNTECGAARFNAVSGSTYFIAIDGKSGASGKTVLCWRLTPINDDFPGTSVSGAVGSSGEISTGATFQVGEPVVSQTGWKTLWYSWRAPRSGPVTFRAYGTNAASIGIFVGDTLSTLVEFACCSAVERIDVDEGVTYRFVIAPSHNNDTAGMRWGNDELDSADVLTGPDGTIQYSNVGATINGGEPQHVAGVAAGASIWYAWQAPFDGNVAFDTVDSSFDTVLAVYSAYSPTGYWWELTARGSNDDADVSRGSSRVVVKAKQGMWYYIAVAGKGSATGNISLSWGVAPYYQLIVSKTGTGSGTVTSSPIGVDCGDFCTYSFVDRSVVTLTAEPTPTSLFVGWSDSSCSGGGICRVMMDRARSLSAIFAAKPDHQPDGLISKTLAGKYVGDGVYNATGIKQTRTITTARGSRVSFYARVENDGRVGDSYWLNGTSSSSGYGVRYFAGSTDITTEVTTGTYGALVEVAGNLGIRVQVRVKATAAELSSKIVRLTASSAGGGTLDTVKAVVAI